MPMCCRRNWWPAAWSWLIVVCSVFSAPPHLSTSVPFACIHHTRHTDALTHIYTHQTPTGTLQVIEEDNSALIITSLAAFSFLICLLITACHCRRKRRHHRQLGLHRNGHYDSTTSATGKSADQFVSILIRLSCGKKESFMHSLCVFLPPFIFVLFFFIIAAIRHVHEQTKCNRVIKIAIIIFEK